MGVCECCPGLLPKNMDDDGVRVALPGSSTLETLVLEVLWWPGLRLAAPTPSYSKRGQRAAEKTHQHRTDSNPCLLSVSSVMFSSLTKIDEEISAGVWIFNMEFPIIISVWYFWYSFLILVGIFTAFYPRVPSGIGARRGGKGRWGRDRKIVGR